MIANTKVLNTANIQDLTNQHYPSYFAHVFRKRQVPKADDSMFYAMSESKVIFTLIAKFALAGYAVYKGQNDDFTVINYDSSLYCQDFAKLQDFAQQLGVLA